MEPQKIWFITGASRGFGFEIAKAALKAGDRVVGTVRNKPSALYASLEDHPNLLVVTCKGLNDKTTKPASIVHT